MISQNNGQISQRYSLWTGVAAVAKAITPLLALSAGMSGVDARVGTALQATDRKLPTRTLPGFPVLSPAELQKEAETHGLRAGFVSPTKPSPKAKTTAAASNAAAKVAARKNTKLAVPVAKKPAVKLPAWELSGKTKHVMAVAHGKAKQLAPVAEGQPEPMICDTVTKETFVALHAVDAGLRAGRPAAKVLAQYQVGAQPVVTGLPTNPTSKQAARGVADNLAAIRANCNTASWPTTFPRKVLPATQKRDAAPQKAAVEKA